jgi:DNA-binding transcriptional LysR family regulator
MLSDEELALIQAISESGSLTRAANALGKAPSTVSHAARQLEARFDALLFDRRRYRLQLTPAGQLLAQEAQRLALDVSRLTRRVKQVAGGWEDRLWIVTDEILEFDTFVPVIRAFDTLQSGVALRITHEVLNGTWEALRDGRADLVIGATNEPPAIPKLRWFELGVMEWVFAVSPRHPLAKVPRAIATGATVALSRRGRGRLIAHHRPPRIRLAVRSADHGRTQHACQDTSTVRGPGDRLAAAPARAIVNQARGVGRKTRRRRARTQRALRRLAQRSCTGRAMEWWLSQLRQPRLAQRLIHGIDRLS